MVDNTNTPRGAKKAITLERNFDRDPWIYNKRHLHEFKETGKDKKKSQILKKLRKKSR